MKRNKKLSGRKAVSGFLALVLVCESISGGGFLTARAESGDIGDTETKSYIIVADDAESFAELTSQPACTMSEENEKFCPFKQDHQGNLLVHRQ